MLDVSKFINLITDYKNISDICDNENLQKYNFSCTCISLKDYNNELINYLSSTDNITLTIKEENIEDAVFVYNNLSNKIDDLRNNYNKFIKTLKEYIDDDDVFSIFISINITKNSDNIVNIYNIEKFKDYLNNNNYEDIIDSFNMIYSNYNNIILVNKSFNTYKVTESISFSNGTTCQYLFDRSNYLKKRKKVCINPKELYVCPNDFHIINDISQYEDIQNHFNQIENILCIKYISNHSQLKKNLLTYRIEGNKILSGSISYDQLIKYNINLYDVYLWIYADINISEKINICRTIISMTYDDILSVDSNLLYTLESNFRIYMIENVERYINVKTSLTDQILEVIKGLNEEYKIFYNAFKNNMFLFISAFISLFIIELGSNVPNNAESEATSLSYIYEIYPIILVFLIASIIWALIGYFELKYKLNDKRTKSVERLINNYRDVLAKDQIKSITEALISDDLSDLKRVSKRYLILWIVMIAVIIIILLFNVFNLNLSDVTIKIQTFLSNFFNNK